MKTPVSAPHRRGGGGACDGLVVQHLLDGYGSGEQQLSLRQLLPLLQDVAQVVHGVDVGGVQSGRRREESEKHKVHSIRVSHAVDGTGVFVIVAYG